MLTVAGQLELQDLRYLIAAAETLNFHRAAEMLRVRPSTLSRRVQRLEDHLGVSLFERHNAGLRLTVAGRDFVGNARAILGSVDHASRRASRAGRGSNGHLSIGVLCSFSSCFPHILLQRFLSAHPEVTLDVTEAAHRENLSGLAERRLDAAFVVGSPRMAGLDAEQVWSERVFIAIPQAHALANESEIKWELLHKERFVVSRGEPGPEIHNFVVRFLTELGQKVIIDVFDVGREALMVLVGLGVGVSVMSEAGTAVNYPGVVFRPLVSGAELPFTMVWHPENDNPALRRFLSLARMLARASASSSLT